MKLKMLRKVIYSNCVFIMEQGHIEVEKINETLSEVNNNLFLQIKYLHHHIERKGWRGLIAGEGSLVCVLTHRRHFWNTGNVRSIQKLWFIIINILHFNNEFWFRFQGFPGFYVHCLSTESIERFFFSVQAPYCVNVSCGLINCKNSASTISREGVFNSALSLVQVGMKLRERGRERERLLSHCILLLVLSVI